MYTVQCSAVYTNVSSCILYLDYTDKKALYKRYYRKKEQLNIINQTKPASVLICYYNIKPTTQH